MSSLATKPPWDLSGEERQLTYGNWETELAAENYLVELLKGLDVFCISRQVDGKPLWKHYFQDGNSVRADLILLPNDRLVKAGWKWGAFVVEVKRSGVKMGPGFNQLLDYMCSAFQLECGTSVVPMFGFLFPAISQGGWPASLMAHRHFGTISEHRDNTVRFYCGHSRVLSLGLNGDIKLGKINFGRGLGAR